jgi:transposase
MDRYIGLDVHAQSTTVAVMSENGKRISWSVVETSASALIEQLKSVKGKKRVVLEEGTQSTWLSQVLTPHVDQLVVMAPKKSDGAKNDLEDAFARAENLRTNSTGLPIFKPCLEAMALQDAVRLYTNFTKDAVRAKNRFKALLRSRGVTGLGREAYDPEPELLEEMLKQVPASVALSAEATLEQIYMMENLRARARDVLIDEARKQPAYRYLLSVPGLGDIRAATVLAVVVTPHRFRRSHHFWSYCGLAIKTASSSDFKRGPDNKWVRHREPMTRGLKHGHPMLKSAFRGAADTVVVRLPDHPLHRHYRRLLQNGTKDNLARLTLARKLAAITLALWKNKEEYDPTKHVTFE